MGFYTLPQCCHCNLPFAALEGPVLLPCHHFVVCQKCLRNSHQLCFVCNEAAADVPADNTLESIAGQLRQKLAQGYENAEDEALTSINDYIATKQTGQVPQSAIDITSLPMRSVDDYQPSDYWRCEMCQIQVPSTSLRCPSCNRVNFQLVALRSSELPPSLGALAQPGGNQGPADYSSPAFANSNSADYRLTSGPAGSGYGQAQVSPAPQPFAFHSQSVHPINQVSPVLPGPQNGQVATGIPPIQGPPAPKNVSRVQPVPVNAQEVEKVESAKTGCCIIV